MNPRRSAIAARITALLTLGVMSLWPILAPADHPSKSAFSLLDEPRPLREVEFIDGDGQPRNLADFRGRIVLLNIWATWCVPCRVEMPALDRLQQTLGGPDFVLIALSIDRDGLPAIKEFYQKHKLQSLGVYVDPWGDASGALGVIGIPTTLIIDRQGREIGRRVGPAEWDGEPIIAELRHYIDERRGERAPADTADPPSSAAENPGADPPDAARVAQGRAVYEAHCAACHGENLQGQPNWKERLPNGRMPPPPHDASGGHTWHHPDAMLFGIIQRGMAPYAWKGYEGDMPAFGGVLTDEEIRAVLAYIKSTWPEKVRAYQSEIDERARRRAASRSTSQSDE